MQSATNQYDFGLGWNFGVDNVFKLSFQSPSNGGNPPIPNNSFLLLNGSPFKLLNGNTLTLL